MDRAIPNKDIIDATQNAVLNAASNMADVLEATADEISGHHEPFYMGAEFWVAMAFVVAVLMILKPPLPRRERSRASPPSLLQNRLRVRAFLIWRTRANGTVKRPKRSFTRLLLPTFLK